MSAPAFATPREARAYARRAKKNYVEVDHNWSNHLSPVMVPVSQQRLFEMIEDFFDTVEEGELTATIRDGNAYWTAYKSDI